MDGGHSEEQFYGDTWGQRKNLEYLFIIMFLLNNEVSPTNLLFLLVFFVFSLLLFWEIIRC